MMAKPNMPENAFTVSMIPWTSFDGFNLNVKSFDYLIPILLSVNTRKKISNTLFRSQFKSIMQYVMDTMRVVL